MLGRQVQGRAEDTGRGVGKNWVDQASSTHNTQTGGCGKGKDRLELARLGKRKGQKSLQKVMRILHN